MTREGLLLSFVEFKEGSTCGANGQAYARSLVILANDVFEDHLPALNSSNT